MVSPTRTTAVPTFPPAMCSSPGFTTMVHIVPHADRSPARCACPSVWRTRAELYDEVIVVGGADSWTLDRSVLAAA